MKQEYKELVIIDLSGRLKYGVKLDFYARATRQHYVCTLLGIEPDGDRPIIAKTDDGAFTFTQDHVKPYLRKMSSMTEEERKEYHKTFFYHERYDNEHKTGQNCSITFETYDWLNKHHFAYRTIDGKDMFELGLALEAPEGMYKF